MRELSEADHEFIAAVSEAVREFLHGYEGVTHAHYNARPVKITVRQEDEGILIVRIRAKE